MNNAIKIISTSCSLSVAISEKSLQSCFFVRNSPILSTRRLLFQTLLLQKNYSPGIVLSLTDTWIVVIHELRNFAVKKAKFETSTRFNGFLATNQIINFDKCFKYCINFFSSKSILQKLKNLQNQNTFRRKIKSNRSCVKIIYLGGGCGGTVRRWTGCEFGPAYPDCGPACDCSKRFMCSMLPTRDSSSSARCSVDCFSSWINLLRKIITTVLL